MFPLLETNMLTFPFRAPFTKKPLILFCNKEVQSFSFETLKNKIKFEKSSGGFTSDPIRPIVSLSFSPPFSF